MKDKRLHFPGFALTRAIAGWLALLLLSAANLPAAERQVLHGHVPAEVKTLGLHPTGGLPATNRLQLAIGLPLRNREALGSLLKELYDPASTNFHRYLTPEQFNERFGPTAADYETVLQFARTNGLAVSSTYSHRQLAVVSATVADIEKAFQVHLLAFQHPAEPRQFFSPDVEPSVPESVPILSLSGLNNYARANSLHPQSANQAQSGSANGTGPKGNYQGKDFRNAYVPGVNLNGSGQLVGLVEMDGFYASDITKYESGAGLPNVPITVVPLSGAAGYPDNNTNYVAEVSLDIEMVISMAPGIAGVYVFEGNSFDEVLASMITYRSIKQFSSSWFGFGFDATGDGLLQQMAAQGQSFFQASGDGDAWTQPIVGPADDPNVTSVGGTFLTLDPTGSKYISEIVWSAGFGNPGWNLNGNVPGGGYWGSGGGISSTYSIPGWQTGVNTRAVGGSSTSRNIPDVALVASGVWVNYFNGLSGPFQGTSIAAPLWAGFTALVNQQAANQGLASVGFLTPALYGIASGPLYSSCFNDITNGNNSWPGSPTQFNSAPGYDLCTGWGTPKGQSLIDALLAYGGTIWVDFNYTNSTEDGSYNHPFTTLAQGTNAVAPGGNIWIRSSGSSSETMTISKPLSIQAYSGPATIGQ